MLPSLITLPGPALARMLFTAGLLLGAAMSVCSAQPDPATLLQLGSSVWKVEAQRVQGGYSMGTGIAVAGEQVLTNCHVTRDARVVHVVRGGLRRLADAQAVDAEHDLCVLRVPGLDGTVAALGSSSTLRPGQTVLALGYTGGQQLQHSEGEVVALHRLDGARVVQSTNAFTSGASGGGLFDQDLRLVGVLTFRLRGGGEHYFSAPIEWLAALRGDAERFTAVQPLQAAALAYWQRAPAAQPYFLRAVVLERERRWHDLLALAQRWADDDTDDPQAWYLNGLALEGLQRWPDAQQALQQALQRDANAPQAWYRLGFVHLQQGQMAQAREALRWLLSAGSRLAVELGRAIDRD